MTLTLFFVLWLLVLITSETIKHYFRAPMLCLPMLLSSVFSSATFMLIIAPPFKSFHLYHLYSFLKRMEILLTFLAVWVKWVSKLIYFLTMVAFDHQADILFRIRISSQTHQFVVIQFNLYLKLLKTLANSLQSSLLDIFRFCCQEVAVSEPKQWTGNLSPHDIFGVHATNLRTFPPLPPYCIRPMRHLFAWRCSQ